MILFDTGPIVAAATANDQHFHSSSELLTGLRLARRHLLLPSTVAAEVGYLLAERVSPQMETQFLRGVANGAFDLMELTRADYQRMAELTERYQDMPLGTTDASVMALAERLGVTEIAILDRRHFAAVRPRRVEAAQPHRHGYWNIDVETLVTTAVDDLPQLIVRLDGAIAELEEADRLDPDS